LKETGGGGGYCDFIKNKVKEQYNKQQKTTEGEKLQLQLIG
jgi:hypothetical protein